MQNVFGKFRIKALFKGTGVDGEWFRLGCGGSRPPLSIKSGDIRWYGADTETEGTTFTSSERAFGWAAMVMKQTSAVSVTVEKV